MPGEQYTPAELREMSREDFEAAEKRGWMRPEFPVPDQAMHPTGIVLRTAAPAPQAGPNVWASKSSEFSDFTCPSGQTCKLRKLQPEVLVQHGILERVTRLEGMADDLVNQAEGAPPSKQKMPSQQDLEMLLETINILIPLAVVEPAVWSIPGGDETRKADRIYVDSIDLEDRMAILEESLKGLRKLDPFRNAG